MSPAVVGLACPHHHLDILDDDLAAVGLDCPLHHLDILNDDLAVVGLACPRHLDIVDDDLDEGPVCVVSSSWSSHQGSSCPSEAELYLCCPLPPILSADRGHGQVTHLDGV